MAALSLEEYSKLMDVEMALDKADRAAEQDSARMGHNEVFESLRRKVNVR